MPERRLFNIVEDVPCSTAEEFLEAVSPWGPHFNQFAGQDIEWIHRGHGDDTYKLIPSAVREYNTPTLHQLAGTEDTYARLPNSLLTQCLAEAKLLFKFSVSADKSGLPIFYDTHSAFESLNDLILDIERRINVEVYNTQYRRNEELGETEPSESIMWPPPWTWPAVGLMQHHGLFTRFLDWTWSPFVAAYFAAKDAIKISIAPERLSLWSLRKEKNRSDVQLPGFDPDRPVSIITVPRYSNSYLHAQSGLFTLYGPERILNANQNLDSLGINEYYERHLGGGHLRPWLAMYHFTLPFFEAGKLLKLLDKINISAATIYPDYRGAAEAVKEQKD